MFFSSSSFNTSRTQLLGEASKRVEETEDADNRPALTDPETTNGNGTKSVEVEKLTKDACVACNHNHCCC